MVLLFFLFLQRLAHSWIKRRNKKWARNFFEVGSGSAFVPSKNIYKNNPQMIFLNALGIFLLSSQAASTNDGSEIDISRNEILFFYRRLFLYIQCFSDDYLNFVRNIMKWKRNIQRKKALFKRLFPLIKNRNWICWFIAL